MTFADWLIEFDLRAGREGLPWRANDLDPEDLRARFDTGLSPGQVVLAIKQAGLGQDDSMVIPELPGSTPKWLGFLGRLFQVTAYCVWVAGSYVAVWVVVVQFRLFGIEWSRTNGSFSFVEATMYLVQQLAFVAAYGGLFMLLGKSIPIIYGIHQYLRKLASKP